MHRRSVRSLLVGVGVVLVLVLAAGCLGTPLADDARDPSSSVHVTLRNDADTTLTYRISVGATPPTHATVTDADGTTRRVTDFPPGLTRYAPAAATDVAFHPGGVVNRTYTLTAGSTVGTPITGLPRDPVLRFVVTNDTHVVAYGTAYCGDGTTETVFLGTGQNATLTSGMQCGPAN